MRISVVATLYFSENYIQEFYARVVAELKKVTADYEIVFVNDGSPDNSKEKVFSLQQNDSNVVLVDLSKNFGHHRAIMAGLHYASGDYIFLIDTDLEEDPELFSKLWAELKDDPASDVVYGVQQKRKGLFFERFSGGLFYKLFYFVAGYEYPADTVTARIMTKRYVDGLKQFSEKEYDIWGLFILNGFHQKAIPVHKKSKGTTTYTLLKKIRVSINSITSLTNRPLYFIFFLGGLISLVSLISVLYILCRKVFLGINVEGWASLIASVWLIGGIIMFTLGIIGIYLSKIFMEVKNRPTSIIKKIYKN